MVSGGKDFAEDAVAKAAHAASLARAIQKKADKAAREALEVMRLEMKHKGKQLETRRAEARKQTMKTYFQSSRGAIGGQPLSLVLDGAIRDVPGVEPQPQADYPNDEYDAQLLRCRRNTSRSQETTVIPSSSSTSGDTVVLGGKSPLITISEDSRDADDDHLVEVSIGSDGFDCDSDFQSPPQKRGATTRSKAETERSRAQKRYNRHTKFQTLWAAKLP